MTTTQSIRMTTETVGEIAINLNNLLCQGSFTLQEKHGRRDPIMREGLRLAKKGATTDKRGDEALIKIHHSKGILAIESVNVSYDGRGTPDFSFSENMVNIVWRDTHNGVRMEFTLTLQ